jgi:hypothetical protein
LCSSQLPLGVPQQFEVGVTISTINPPGSVDNQASNTLGREQVPSPKQASTRICSSLSTKKTSFRSCACSTTHLVTHCLRCQARLKPIHAICTKFTSGPSTQSIRELARTNSSCSSHPKVVHPQSTQINTITEIENGGLEQENH